MDLLADCLGRFIGGSLNPEVWIAIGATIVAGRTLRQFAFASVCGAILLVIFWSVLARPLLLSVTYPRDLFSVTYPRELNWADVLSYFFSCYALSVFGLAYLNSSYPRLSTFGPR